MHVTPLHYPESIMSRVYEALRKLGSVDPERASSAGEPPATVEGDEAEWPSRPRPLESRRLGGATLQWPPPEPSAEDAQAAGGSLGDVAAPSSRPAASTPPELSFSELIRAIARDEQDLGY